MPEHRDLPLFRWGEELRRQRLARRATRLRGLAAGGALAALTALVVTSVWPPRPVLVWNASASSPVGLYYVGPAKDARAGDMAVAWAPARARELGAERGYLPRNVPLVKRIAAAGGDRVCAIGEAIFVNGRLEASRRTADGTGRPMPWWSGCELLAPGEIFLLAGEEDSAFDGRYFGKSEPHQVVGRARLLWAR
jgi:conjugative transfer signal peptidase TraF